MAAQVTVPLGIHDLLLAGGDAGAERSAIVESECGGIFSFTNNDGRQNMKR
jgi:hypothetical protein